MLEDPSLRVSAFTKLLAVPVDERESVVAPPRHQGTFAESIA